MCFFILCFFYFYMMFFRFIHVIACASIQLIQYVLSCFFMCNSLQMDSLPLSHQGSPYSSDGKEPACNAGDLGSIPGSGRFLGKGNGNPLQYS